MLAHRILGGCSSSISISCPSLGSELIAAARACLWSSFQWCSAFCGQTGKESPLLTYPKTMGHLSLRKVQTFSWSPSQLAVAHSPLSGHVHTANPSLLPGIFPSKPKPQLPALTCPTGGADKPLRLVSSGQHQSSVWDSLCFALCTPVAVLSSMAPKLPPHPPPDSASEGAS